MRSTDYREAAQKIQKYINTMYQTIVKGVGRGSNAVGSGVPFLYQLRWFPAFTPTIFLGCTVIHLSTKKRGHCFFNRISTYFKHDPRQGYVGIGTGLVLFPPVVGLCTRRIITQVF